MIFQSIIEILMTKTCATRFAWVSKRNMLLNTVLGRCRPGNPDFRAFIRK